VIDPITPKDSNYAHGGIMIPKNVANQYDRKSDLKEVE
jgi:hypothetical protein